MGRLITAAALAASFSARYPNAQAGIVESLQASAEQPGQVNSLEAMAVRDLSAPSGKQVYVKALINFLQQGVLVHEGDIVQVFEEDAKRLIRYERAAPVTDAEVAAAQKASK